MFRSVWCGGLAALAIGVGAMRLPAADNWPHWRGPAGTGVAPAGDYPVKFSADAGAAWKIEVPGRGMSTPAVWDDQIFLTAGVDGQNAAICYGFDGQERWRVELGAERAGKHRNGSGSNPSPATDGEHVVVYFKSGDLACLSVDGKTLWHKNLQKEYGADTLWWDLATSPVLSGGRAIVAVMQDGDSYLAAFDAKTGDVAWKTPRTYDRPQESDQAYTTPQIVELGGRQVAVTWGADHLTGHDAATGELLWEVEGFNPTDAEMWRVIASATVTDGFAVVPWGRGKQLSGVKLPTAKSEGGKPLKASWEKLDLGADVPTPAARDGAAYVLTDEGQIACLEAATGRARWTETLPKNRNRFYASPVLAGDTLYAVREDGVVFVGRVSDAGLDLLSTNDMGERIVSTPAPVRSGLLLRGETHLFWIPGSESTAASERGAVK